MAKKCKITKKAGNWTTLKCGKYKVQIKHFDEPSGYGIKNGRISKLWIQDSKTKKEMANYDRGWDVRVKKGAKSVYNQILKKYN